jgi:hypothetical protein
VVEEAEIARLPGVTPGARHHRIDYLRARKL